MCIHYSTENDVYQGLISQWEKAEVIRQDAALHLRMIMLLVKLVAMVSHIYLKLTAVFQLLVLSSGERLKAQIIVIILILPLVSQDSLTAIM